MDINILKSEQTLSPTQKLGHKRGATLTADEGEFKKLVQYNEQKQQAKTKANETGSLGNNFVKGKFLSSAAQDSRGTGIAHNKSKRTLLSDPRISTDKIQKETRLMRQPILPIGSKSSPALKSAIQTAAQSQETKPELRFVDAKSTEKPSSINVMSKSFLASSVAQEPKTNTASQSLTPLSKAQTELTLKTDATNTNTNTNTNANSNLLTRSALSNNGSVNFQTGNGSLGEVKDLNPHGLNPKIANEKALNTNGVNHKMAAAKTLSENSLNPKTANTKSLSANDLHHKITAEKVLNANGVNHKTTTQALSANGLNHDLPNGKGLHANTLTNNALTPNTLTTALLTSNTSDIKSLNDNALHANPLLEKEIGLTSLGERSIETKTLASDPERVTISGREETDLSPAKFTPLSQLSAQSNFNTKTAKSEGELSTVTSFAKNEITQAKSNFTKLSTIETAARFETKSSHSEPNTKTLDSDLNLQAVSGKDKLNTSFAAATLTTTVSSLETQSIQSEPQVAAFESSLKPQAETLQQAHRSAPEIDLRTAQTEPKREIADLKVKSDLINSAQLNTASLEKASETVNNDAPLDRQISNAQLVNNDEVFDPKNNQQAARFSAKSETMTLEVNDKMVKLSTTSAALVSEDAEKAEDKQLRQSTQNIVSLFTNEETNKPSLSQKVSDNAKKVSEEKITTMTPEPILTSVPAELTQARPAETLTRTDLDAKVANASIVDTASIKPESALSFSPLQQVNTQSTNAELQLATAQSQAAVSNEMLDPKVAHKSSQHEKEMVQSEARPPLSTAALATNLASSVQQLFQPKVQNSNVSPIADAPNSVINQINMPHQQQMTTPTPTISLPVPMTNPQWQESLGQQIMLFNRQDIQKAEIKLHPEELGSLHIKLEMNDGKMQLHMSAAQSAVRGMLESAIPHLRSSLAEQGIDLQQTNISHASTSDSSSQQSMFSQQRNTEQGKPTFVSNDDVDLVEQGDMLESEVQSGLSVFA